MADFNALQAVINAYIKKNGVQAITGQILNGVLTGMVNALGKGWTIAGEASPSTDPGLMTGPVAYIAHESGTYTHFDNIVVDPGEVAMLIFNESAWTKNVLASLAANATVDDQVGTPAVTTSFVNGVLTFDFRNMKGNPGTDGIDGTDGVDAGFGTIDATVDANIGTPGVNVVTSGPNTAKNMTFQFTNLKGQKGDTGVTSVVVTVDNNTGIPGCTASVSGGVLTLAFTNLKGAQGDTGVSADYPITIANNLATDDPTSALSASMGVQLESEINQLEAKVDDLSTGKYYGYFADSEELPEGTVPGFAYVGEGPTYNIWNFNGEEWTNTEISVNQSPIGNDEDIDQNEDGKLQFANRTYNSLQPNGMGYKILRKDATFAEQVTDTNTIYEFRYDFALSADFTMPAGCVLLFNGGQIKGAYTITGVNTLITGNLKNIFDGVTLGGVWDNESCNLEWWGCVPYDQDNEVDNSQKIQLCFNSTIRKRIVSGIYGVSYPVNTGVGIIEGNNVDNFANCGFVANQDFQPTTAEYSGVSYSVTGVLWHWRFHSPIIRFISIDAKYKAECCIESVQIPGNVSTPLLENLYLTRAKFAGVLQYAAEKPIFRHLWIEGCPIGIITSTTEVDRQNPFNNTGASMGACNMLKLEDCRCLDGNYGIIVRGGSDFTFMSCQTSHNSLFGMGFFATYGKVIRSYSEGDGMREFYLNADGSKVEAVFTDGELTSYPQYILDNNLDGIEVTLLEQSKSAVRIRAPYFTQNCRITFDHPSISNHHRSTKRNVSTDADFAPMTTRQAVGIDARFISYYTTDEIYVNFPRYANNSGSGTIDVEYDLVSVVRVTGEQAMARFSGMKNPVNFSQPYIGAVAPYNNDNIGEILNGHFHSDGLLSKSGCIPNNLTYGTSAKDFRQNSKLVEIWNGFPLYECHGFAILRMTTAQRDAAFGGAKVLKMVLILKAESEYTLSSADTCQVQFKKSGGVVQGAYSYLKLAAGKIKKGYHVIEAIVPVVLGDDSEYTYIDIQIPGVLNHGDPNGLICSPLLFYPTDAEITPPTTPAILESGTTAKRPLYPFVGQQFFDETLGKNLVYNGTDWVNMDGTALS